MSRIEALESRVSTSFRIAERIRARRAGLALTQGQLAELLGVDQSSVARWEGGDRMDARRLPVLAEFLGVAVEALAWEYVQNWHSD